MKERAAVIMVNDGRILLMHRRRTDRDYCVAPGGGVEPGETAMDAGVQEA
ncbi:MAG: NUDIX domain-containing protein [Actinomycetota bacterium]|nr:NUDIX domain-containing protein [Actinomycetota bacterium]